MSSCNENDCHYEDITNFFKSNFPYKGVLYEQAYKIISKFTQTICTKYPIPYFCSFRFFFFTRIHPPFTIQRLTKDISSLSLFHTESKIIDLSQVVQMVWVPNDRTEAAHNNRSVSRGKRKSFLSAQFRLQRRQAKTRGTR